MKTTAKKAKKTGETFQTKFKIHETVFCPDYRTGEISDFTVETIDVSIFLGYSGNGGCHGKYQREIYMDAHKEFKEADHNLCHTREEAQKKIDEYNQRFPKKVCKECGKTYYEKI